MMKAYAIKISRKSAGLLLAVGLMILTFNGQQAFSTTLADSVADFSLTQGSNNWYYGYYSNPGSDLTEETFLLLGATTGNMWHHSTTWFPPWTMVDDVSLHPNGTNAPFVEEWAVRRWVSPATTIVNLSGDISKLDLGGNGVVARIALDGVVLYTANIAPNDNVGVSFNFNTPITAGSVLDFLVDPDGEDSFDTTFFTVVITEVPEPSSAGVGLLGGLALFGLLQRLRPKNRI